MSTTTKTINMETYAKTKKYVYTTEFVVMDRLIDGRQYAHPIIKFYELWQYNNQFSRGFCKFAIRYQTHKENDVWKPSYSGTIEGADIDNIEDINKIIQSANRKIKELNIYSPDYYRNMITALRAAGYKEGHGDDHYITWID